MKIKIGKYLNYWGPYQLIDLLFFWHEKYPSEELDNRWDYRLHDKIAIWLANTWVADFCQWIYDKRKRTIKIHIDNYDIWGMDHTLALIILPMLKLLKEQKHGSPYVDDSDVPEELGIRSTDDIESDPEIHSDAYIHARWNWVIDEMIWSFGEILSDRYISPYNAEEYKITQSRIDNGLRLFGKYYRALWD